ncbi:MAG: efflux RND transporter periplasmic adaptor subunit [Coriobacteriia bacterium]|nr:efflux RND transporter periplasmic adaptor subunit [Coriobacteriia bacterium]MCL2745657.1 efflux RND transporter periplasmic adaptor subunit [Coriobacteriia bacterium]MCL2871326.1 efflux RND transporter periplasmic adaptor subunit [Coriobacteriia bacterium]
MIRAIDKDVVVKKDTPKTEAKDKGAAMETAKAVTPAKKSTKSPARSTSLKPKTTTNGKDKKKRGNKKRIIWIVIVVVLALGIVGGFLALQGLGVAVETAEAENNDIAITVFATGAVTPGTSRDVYPETQGLVESVRVSEGDMVQEGDILATLDGAANMAQLSQAQSGLASARSGLSQAESAQRQANAGRSQANAGRSQANAGVTAANAGVTAANAARDAAQAGLDSAIASERALEQEISTVNSLIAEMSAAGLNASNSEDFVDLQMLVVDLEDHLGQARAGVTQARSGVTQADAGIAQARAGVDQARAGVEAADAGIDQARAGETESAIAAARSGVTAAEDAVALAETAVEASIIRAPKDGMVLFAPTAASAAAMGTGITPISGAELMQGSAVTPGSPLFTIVDEDTFSFTAEVDEVDVRRIAEGQRADVTLSAYSGRTFDAEVRSISKLAMPTLTGGTVFEVELSFAEEVPDVRIGMRGDTTIEIETQENVLTIPIDAWFSEAGEDFVYLIDDDSQLVRTPVTVGASTEFVVEVIEGIEEGVVVAMAGGAPVPLEDGMTVTPVP